MEARSVADRPQGWAPFKGCLRRIAKTAAGESRIEWGAASPAQPRLRETRHHPRERMVDPEASEP